MKMYYRTMDLISGLDRSCHNWCAILLFVSDHSSWVSTLVCTWEIWWGFLTAHSTMISVRTIHHLKRIYVYPSTRIPLILNTQWSMHNPSHSVKKLIIPSHSVKKLIIPSHSVKLGLHIFANQLWTDTLLLSIESLYAEWNIVCAHIFWGFACIPGCLIAQVGIRYYIWICNMCLYTSSFIEPFQLYPINLHGIEQTAAWLVLINQMEANYIVSLLEMIIRLETWLVNAKHNGVMELNIAWSRYMNHYESYSVLEHKYMTINWYQEQSHAHLSRTVTCTSIKNRRMHLNQAHKPLSRTVT